MRRSSHGGGIRRTVGLLAAAWPGLHLLTSCAGEASPSDGAAGGAFTFEAAGDANGTAGDSANATRDPALGGNADDSAAGAAAQAGAPGVAAGETSGCVGAGANGSVGAGASGAAAGETSVRAGASGASTDETSAGAGAGGSAGASGGAGASGSETAGADPQGGGPAQGGGAGVQDLASSGGGQGTAGAADGGAGAEPTDSESAFQPCPDVGPCKVLPLGDSITFGLGFDGGYRVELFHLANQAGYDITFTGTQPPNGPGMLDGKPFPRKHAGISGQLIAEIAGRVPSPDLGEMPNIILVHAGTNDIFRSPAGAEGRLGELMDKLIMLAPDALLAFSDLIPLTGGGGVDAFNQSVPGMVEERAAMGAHIVFVEQFAGFPTSELGDGVHPNEQGYARMAGRWYEAIEPYLR